MKSELIRIPLLVLHGFLALTAIGAGQALARDPSGKALGFDVNWLAGSPLKSYRIPGVVLSIVIGGANVAGLIGQQRRSWWAPAGSLAKGGLLLIWLAIQTAIIGIRHWTQFLWLVLFTLVAALGALGTRTANRPGRAG